MRKRKGNEAKRSENSKKTKRKKQSKRNKEKISKQIFLSEMKGKQPLFSSL
jgi:hypothetical protein